MKFYIALDIQGAKQIRATQDDIKKVNKTFEQVEIPTNKEGLMHLVQDSFDTIFKLEQIIKNRVAAEPVMEIDTSDIPEATEEFFETATLRLPDPAPAAPSATEALAAQPEEGDADELDVRILEHQIACLGVAGVDGLEHFDGWTQTIGISPAFHQGVALLNIVAADDSQMAKIYLRDKIMKRIQRRTY